MRVRWIATALALLLAAAAPASGFDAAETFKKGTFILSGEGTYGWQTNAENTHISSHLEFYDVGVRFSLVPFDPVGRDHFWYGALEAGLEPLYQHYTAPQQAFWAGLSAVLRYHFLALGRFVGASVFLSDKTALYLGYRLQHVSNGNTGQPNRGFEANAVVGGMSFYFP